MFKSLFIFFSFILINSFSLAQVNVTNIPKKYNPKVQVFEFDTNGIKSLKISLPGRLDNKNFSLKYDKKNKDGRAVVKVYTAEFESKTSVNGLRMVNDDSESLSINMGGNYSYSCSIKIVNKKINKLEGACFIKVEVVMPANSKVEIYNNGSLISKMFYAQKIETLFKNLKQASFDDNKTEYIDAFLDSYKATKNTLEITAEELGLIIGTYSFDRHKIDVLKKLHKFVIDRENLKNLIDSVFTFNSEKKEAYKIVGL